MRADNTLTIMGIVRKLRRRHGIRVSRDTVRRSLKKMGFTHKRLSKVPLARSSRKNKQARRLYAEEIRSFRHVSFYTTVSLRKKFIKLVHPFFFLVRVVYHYFF